MLKKKTNFEILIRVVTIRQMHLVDKTSQEVSQCDRSKKGNSRESYLHGEPTRSGFVSNTHV